MENASKALLIAGSILIVILLIAVGLRIFNSTNGTTEAAKTTMDATAVSVHNNKFISYIGTNKSKNEVVSLITTVIANNAKSNTKVYISFKGEPATNTKQGLNNIISNRLGDKKYKMEISGTVNDPSIKDGYYESSKAIGCIAISEVS